MKHACRYAIVRFMPYLETGEFANVGLLLMSPTARFFGFRMLDSVRRVTAFFDELDPNIFRRARKTYQQELMRIGASIEHAFCNVSPGLDPDYAKFAFTELVKPRQAIMYADAERAVLADDPAEKLLELFDHYVGRVFVTRAYQEREVEKGVQRILKSAELAALYKQQVLIGDDAYRARLPFARINERGQAIRAIKPLFLAHDDPSRLYDHGWDWLGKVKKLRRDDKLIGDIMFAVRRPAEEFGPHAEAFADVKQDLEREDFISVVSDSDERGILAFAQD
ncbi:DUF3037 domain-containing protein [Mycetohabitans sp. B46]|uniref:DUF3037 domain-containing protein n=1 Tax=Mycetohabitans sp. B46 TaxID=2772536 RepID=UPI00307CD92B